MKKKKESIRMTLLCEDQARMGFRDKTFSGQHGLAVFIEAETTILLDAGPSAVVLENARLAGIDLMRTEWIVLSHGHWDHADGLLALAESGIRPKLICHPGVFVDRRKPTGDFNGVAFDRGWAADMFSLTEHTTPHQIADNIWFLGEIPRQNDFEAQQTAFSFMQDEKLQPDFLPDDTALAIGTDRGLVVVSGCSHAGICNICEYAKQVTGEHRLHTVLGGFHLLDDSVVLDKTIAYFKDQQQVRLYPMHCTALPALARFYQAFKIEKLCTGDTLTIE